ncbi:hypothetical protein EMIHUDRAFT_423891 [Emiliania huxleyi CCMP1516]|uniref:Helicase-associated domain-containing protein n=2 Tax=Emiliania huxleyi TaxID=2903 RepID=A0A0D3K635_EMIH1|nr:hypothetical protein EMIHUDRAFT_423891 [Emiliania huxleyi CCMP1516]EOD31220.1 hypothetical protein EMIHUDRAFT_423891 [Emiliania huxleyi CCMP1516]|eukprot:XP_005783649.1 hypothetical protein EMIHUDRAFT_423891 [Emiliania huxleyi CCMP1516]
MQRTPLAGLVLSILSLGLGPPGPFLARALQPPSADAVEESCRSLRLAGALDAADALTLLGAHLARMPLDVRVGKMVLYGALLGCIDPMLTIAAALSTRRSPFLAPFEQRQAGRRRRGAQALHRRALGPPRVPARLRGLARREARRRRRRWPALLRRALPLARCAGELHALREQLSGVLADLGFASSTREAMEGEGEGVASVHHASLVRAIVCAGLYPNVLRARMPDTRFVDTVGGAVEAEDERGIVNFYLAERWAGGRVFLQHLRLAQAALGLVRLQRQEAAGATAGGRGGGGSCGCGRLHVRAVRRKGFCVQAGVLPVRRTQAERAGGGGTGTGGQGGGAGGRGDGRLIVRAAALRGRLARCQRRGGHGRGGRPHHHRRLWPRRRAPEATARRVAVAARQEARRAVALAGGQPDLRGDRAADHE